MNFNMFETSTTLADLFAALSSAQAELSNVHKTAENTFFSNNSKKAMYATLDDALDIIRPVLGKHGLALIQNPVSIPRETPIPQQFGMWVGKAQERREIVVTYHQTHDHYLVTTLVHSSGQFQRSASLLNPNVDAYGRVTPQALGSAITYARRYDAMSALGIAAADDDDGAAGSGLGNGEDRTPESQDRGNRGAGAGAGAGAGKTVKPIGDTIAAINKAQEPALKKAEEHLANSDNGLNDAQKKVIKTAIDKRRKALAATVDKAAA